MSQSFANTDRDFRPTTGSAPWHNTNPNDPGYNKGDYPNYLDGDKNYLNPKINPLGFKIDGQPTAEADWRENIGDQEPSKHHFY